MGSKKLKQRSKEVFISPRVSLSVGLELETLLLAASKLSVEATGQEVESITYFENETWN